MADFAYTSPADLNFSNSYDSSAASPSVSSSTPAPEPHKRKRKQWGQPIPEIKEVIGPRKRAKTAEEKEQRKNERILRNRRAADKSRQRQKQASAELQQENAVLRQQLAEYQALFGNLPQRSSSHPPTELTYDTKYNSAMPTSFDAGTSETSHTPALSYESPMSFQPQQSPVLAHTLFPSQDETEQANLDFPGIGTFETGMTQYPAVILCGLQCQPLSDKFQAFQVKYKVNFSIHLIMLMALLEVYKTCSTSMVSFMMTIFDSMVKILSTPLMDQVFLNSYFHLIHCLISTRTSKTNPGKFRTKLLSRLLTCSPRLPRLLMAAADRALHDVVSKDDFASDPDLTWMWVSLTTMKWTILTLEKEHARYRLCTKGVLDYKTRCEKPALGPSVSNGVMVDISSQSQFWEQARMPGVDYDAVRESLSQWVVVGSMDSFQIDDNQLNKIAPIEAF